MADQGTETVRTRPRESAVPRTISTTQQLPPPPPGRWERFWLWMRTSRFPRAALIVGPAVVIIGVGVATGSGTKSSFPPVAPDVPPPVPEGVIPDAIDQWAINAEPVLADIERDMEGVGVALVAGEGALAVLHCRDSSERVADWSRILVPAPDATLETELRAALAGLGQAFDSCSTASLESIGDSIDPFRDASERLMRARHRLDELRN
jgi:hypothetical protein